jgi:colanic acid biosynthesis glycosyl transferase WcaI
LKVLLLNQCFWPDVVATSQQLTGVARELSARGHQVTVIASRHGYDDPKLSFPARERFAGVEIIRLRSIALGKNTRWRRAVNFASFSIACAFRLLLTRPQDAVMALTSPPLISSMGSWFTRLKGGRMVLWLMDLNPDEAIAAGWLKPDSMPARLLEALSRKSMRHAHKIIVLDRFMKERIVAKGLLEAKIAVISPARDDSVRFDAEGREAFRRRHSLTEKFVVMHAGNHSPCHPLDTLLEAANELRDREDIAFCFVGGGSELIKVQQFARTRQLENVVCLPYQPQEELPAVLSAADLHVVIMGEGFPGIIHPCKIYNILATGSPFLYLGPEESHIQDIIAGLPEEFPAASIRTGETPAIVKVIVDRADVAQRNPTPRFGFSGGSVSTLSQVVAQIEFSGPAMIEAEAAKLQSASRA